MIRVARLHFRPNLVQIPLLGQEMTITVRKEIMSRRNPNALIKKMSSYIISHLIVSPTSCQLL